MADYTLDQLRSLWEEGSKAGNFASAGYDTRLSPEGEGGGGQTYESVGINPNSIYLQGGNPKYSMPTLTKLSDEEGGGFRSVTDMLGGAEHVTYSPEGKVIDRKFYDNPDPSHQEFFKRFLPIVAGGALASMGGAAGAAAGGAGNTGGITAATLGELGINTGVAGLPAGASVLPTGAVVSATGEVLGTLPSTFGSVAPGAAAGAAGAAGATGAGSNLLGDAAKAGISKLISDPRLLTSLAAGAGAAALTNRENKKKIGPVGFQGKIDPNRLKYNRDTGEYTVRATGEKYAAGGGIAGLKPNEYKAGGRYLSGPGDGMSDNIKANIDGQQEARLADGEFVIPADVVSHIGNGSSNAGAKKLHAMMNRIRHARTGNPKQGKQIKPEKYLPA